jgi:SAM-dependent methyltransferase
LLIKGFLPAVKELPEQLEGGIRVADLGCGTGQAVNVMARQYPNSVFRGYDFDGVAIARAAAEATDMGLTNARFEVLDVTQLPENPKFDLITTFDSIHDQGDPARVLRAAAEALAPDGVYFMVEPRASSQLEDNIGNPFAPYIYGVSVMHCLTVSLAEGGAGLGTAWGEQTARRMLEEAGFTTVEVVDAPGPQNSIYICRPSAASGNVCLAALHPLTFPSETARPPTPPQSSEWAARRATTSSARGSSCVPA